MPPAVISGKLLSPIRGWNKGRQIGEEDQTFVERFGLLSVLKLYQDDFAS